MDIATFAPMLKLYYKDGRPPLRTYKDFPTLRLIGRDENWTGDNHEMPIWVEAPQAIGPDFPTAQASKVSGVAGQGVFRRWSLTRATQYGFASLDRLTLLASMSSERAFLQYYTTAVDGTMEMIQRDLSWKIFRTRRSLRGTVGAVGNGAGTNDRVTLATRSDVVSLSVGMRLTFTDTTGSNALITWATSNPVIGSIDRSAGTFDVTNGVGGAALNLTTGDSISAAVAAGDLIYRRGDVLTASDTLGIAGFEDWIPSAAPSSTLFFGVNRTVDSDKLSGVRVSGTSASMEEALFDAGARAFESGIKPKYYVCNPFRLNQLAKEMASKLVRDDSETQKLGTKVFDLSTNAGDAKIFADPCCQRNIIWGLDPSTFKLVSTRPYPHLIDDDFKMIREPSSDAYEVRMGGYGQLGCHYPGGNLRVDLS